MKHTSTVLEPSIPFHTLVKLVDAEDIANDKIRIHDLTLEINSITNQLQSQIFETKQSEYLLFTQTRDPNNKHKPAYKKYCSHCRRTNRSISACFKKQRDDEDKRGTYARSKSPQKSFVQYFRSSSREKSFYRTNNKPTGSYDRYRSRSTLRHSKTNRSTSSQNRYRSHSRDRYRYDRTTTPPSLTDQDMASTDEIHVLVVHHTDLHIDRHIEEIRYRYRSRSYHRDRQFPQYTSSYRPPSQPRESRPFRSRSSSETKNKVNIIQT